MDNKIKEKDIIHTSSIKSLKEIIDNPLISNKFKNAAVYELGRRESIIENGDESNVQKG